MGGRINLGNQFPWCSVHCEVKYYFVNVINKWNVVSDRLDFMFDGHSMKIWTIWALEYTTFWVGHIFEVYHLYHLLITTLYGINRSDYRLKILWHNKDVYPIAFLVDYFLPWYNSTIKQAISPSISAHLKYWGIKTII